MDFAASAHLRFGERFLVVIWAYSGRRFPLPIFPLVFWGMGLFAHIGARIILWRLLDREESGEDSREKVKDKP